MVGKPIVMEISSDMLATMYAGVTKDGENIVDLTEFVNDKIVPEIKRIDGVASVSTTGDVTQSVEIRLDQKKIDAVNKKVLKKVNSKLADALDKITDGESKLKDGKSEIKSQKKKLEKTEKKTTKQLATATKGLNQAIATKSAYESQVASIKAQIAALEAEKKGYNDGYNKINEAIKQFKKMQPDNDSLPSDIEDANDHPEKISALVDMLKAIGQDEAAKGFSKETINMLVNAKKTRIPQIDTELANGKTKLLTAEAVLKNVKKALKAAESNYEKVEQGKMSAATQFGAAYAGLNSAESTLKQSEEELKNAKKTYEDSLDTARKNANINALLEMDTLAQILSAQNFDMPAGYISDDKTQYLLKVGKEFESLEELKNLVLMKMDGVGDVKISDVAYVTIIDDSINKYAKIGDNQAVVLSITKSSTAFTSEVSDKCNETMKDLEKRYKGVKFEVVMDQGEYIDVIVNSVLSNLVYGAGLAVVVLLFFLMDWRPTVIIAISIPLSVMFAVVLMYFTDITFNVISLSGLALGIGMLVDNSVVSIENIYRLRAEGVPAARAAVYGAKQIAAAITASTITTIRVFLPILFTDGLTRELMIDMCLTITYSLVASLVVALTVVPTMSATFFRNSKEKDHRLFEHFLNGYEKVLRGCLKVKVVPILVAIILLVLCTYKLVTMGIIIFPEMGSESVSVDVKFNPEYENEEIIEFTDKMLEDLKDVEGVDRVGAMAQSGAMQLYGISGVDEGNLTSMSFFCQLKEGYGHKNTKIAKKIEAMMEKDEHLEDYTVQASDMDMGSMLGSGLSIKITGNDTDKLLSISEDVMDILKGYEGFEEISNGQEEGDDQINIIVDKNKAARLGLTVAQVYSEILKGTTTTKNATSVTIDEDEFD
ncbi:MAG: efflux RND transporter permease subunit, partial [Lachnospiraceae bacterium]|nr:efflux RND transporter permease subunit [Lachnospiraceae bacterium]